MTATDPTRVRIRMYNVGFGDAFLLHLPTDGGVRTMLIDCGQHIGGKANKMSLVIDDLIKAVTVDGTARIDVVVATHRHFDHISGFDSKKWASVEVGEVWMPWTEERGNAEADAIRTAENRLAAALAARFEPTTKIGWLAFNSYSNAGAETTLRTGFTNVERRRYLPSVTRKKRTFTTSILPGVTVHAMGPSHHPDVIADLYPPEEQAYPALAALAAADGSAIDPALLEEMGDLFAPRHVLDPAAFAASHPDLAADATADQVAALVEADLFGAASDMEDAINGTSLMLMLEVAGHYLLFAGDAEWGTWKEALADAEWNALLRRTTVYKVSHHGSYNGTPFDFPYDLLADDAISLMSFRTVAKWPSIPRKSLVDALGAGDRTLIRSDEMPPAGADISRKGDLWVELTAPKLAS